MENGKKASKHPKTDALSPEENGNAVIKLRKRAKKAKPNVALQSAMKKLNIDNKLKKIHPTEALPCASRSSKKSAGGVPKKIHPTLAQPVATVLSPKKSTGAVLKKIHPTLAQPVATVSSPKKSDLMKKIFDQVCTSQASVKEMDGQWIYEPSPNRKKVLDMDFIRSLFQGDKKCKECCCKDAKNVAIPLENLQKPEKVENQKKIFEIDEMSEPPENEFGRKKPNPILEIPKLPENKVGSENEKKIFEIDEMTELPENEFGRKKPNPILEIPKLPENKVGRKKSNPILEIPYMTELPENIFDSSDDEAYCTVGEIYYSSSSLTSKQKEKEDRLSKAYVEGGRDRWEFCGKGSSDIEFRI